MGFRKSLHLLITVLAGSIGYSKTCLSESFIKIGSGVTSPAGAGAVDVSMTSFGFRDQILGALVYQYEAGLWLDSAGNGRKSSALFNICIGLEVVSGPVVARSVHGPAFISTPDSRLGGYFPNFNHDIYLGLRDRRGNAVGLTYKHVSNAGLMPPNVGRDFLSVDIGIPW